MSSWRYSCSAVAGLRASASRRRCPSFHSWRACSTAVAAMRPHTLAPAASTRDVHAAAVGPERFELCANPVAELVAGLREREGEVRVEALQPLWRSCPADAEVERAAAVGADAITRELPPDLPLALSRVLEAGGEHRVGGCL